MKTEHTLRYLLLRHLERFEPVVDRAAFHEVVRSLRVTADREGFDVRWSADGDAQQRRFPRSAFSFYTRGDRSPEAHALEESLANRNDAAATAFAEEVFGCSAPPMPASLAPPRDPYRAAASAGAVALGIALHVVGGLDATASLLVSAWLLLEHAPYGRLVACAPLLGLATLGSAAAAAFGALAYGALQLLDPDTRWRRTRIALCLAAVVLAALRGSPIAPGVLEALAVFAAFGLAVQRSLFASHLRAVPLALPFYFAGLALGGELRASVLGLVLVALGVAAVASAHRFWPVRRGA